MPSRRIINFFVRARQFSRGTTATRVRVLSRPARFDGLEIIHPAWRLVSLVASVGGVAHLLRMPSAKLWPPGTKLSLTVHNVEPRDGPLQAPVHDLDAYLHGALFAGQPASVVVHFDNSPAPAGFCEAREQGGVMTRDEARITCRACIERLRGIDMLTPRASVSLAAAARRIDWYGES